MRFLFKDCWEKYRIFICYSIFIMIGGTLLHFVYEWSNENSFVAMFSAVNESVWEHLKIFFVPALFFTLFAFCYKGEEYPAYLWCQTKSILTGLVFIVVVYFTYTGITERNCSFIDIGSFYVAAIISGIVSERCMKKSCDRNGQLNKLAGVILLVLWAMFICFTYRLPAFLAKWMPGLFLE